MKRCDDRRLSDGIIIIPKTTYILTDYTVPRRIFTDFRDWPHEQEQRPLARKMWHKVKKTRCEVPTSRYTTLEVDTALQGATHL